MEEQKVEKVEVVQEGNPKSALISFILALVGFAGAGAGFVGAILGIVSLNFNKKAGVVTQKPHSIFKRIAKPVAIVDIIAGFATTVLYIVLIVVAIVGAIVAYEAI